MLQIKALLSKDVTIGQIPHVKGISSSDIIKLIVEDWDGEDFLFKNYIDCISKRTWFADICKKVYLTILIDNTLDAEKIQDIVKSIVKNRESKMLKRNNQCIQVNLRIVKIIKSFQIESSKIVYLISWLVSKGGSHHPLKKKLLKDEKEMRNRAEDEKELANNSITPMRRAIQELKRELNEKEKELESYSNYFNLLHSLFKRGVIDLEFNLK